MGSADAVISLAAGYRATEAVARRRIAVDTEKNNMSFVGDGYHRGLRAVGSALNVAENRAIYGEGDAATFFFKVALGVVRTCTFLSDGRRQIDAFYVPGDVFGLEAGAEHSLSAETVCESAIISYRRSDLEALAANGEGLSYQLFRYAMQNLARAQQHAVLLGRRSALEKVAAFLIDWAAYSPTSDVLTLEMPRQDIADYLGLTTETVSRAFSHLEGKALIELPTARQILLKDREGLHHLNS
jgi:CRP/FNR family transcriptional regulator, nitrogen fixation regulation protein